EQEDQTDQDEHEHEQNELVGQRSFFGAHGFVQTRPVLRHIHPFHEPPTAWFRLKPGLRTAIEISQDCHPNDGSVGCRERAISAVVAQQLYTLWVGGSNPSSPTIFHRLPCALRRDRSLAERLEGGTFRVGGSRWKGEGMASTTIKRGCKGKR